MPISWVLRSHEELREHVCPGGHSSTAVVAKMHEFAAWSLAHYPRAILDMQSFWSRLAGKYGNKFFWQESGEQAAIVNAVCHAAIVTECLASIGSLLSENKPGLYLTDPPNFVTGECNRHVLAGATRQAAVRKSPRTARRLLEVNGC